MKHKIKSSTLPVVEISLNNKESIYSEAGKMSWMDDNIEMITSTRGGILKGIGRMFGGESFFLVTYNARGKGKITFSSEFPGNIVPVKLGPRNEMIIQKDSFLCAEDSVKLEMHFRKRLGTGLFGGEGFILQRVKGPGTVFVEFDGDVTEIKLKPGQKIKVDTGHIAMYEPSVNYSVQMVGGLKNIFFAGEGLFLATLRGPGRVWLQSMPIKKLARQLYRYMPKPSGQGKSSGVYFGNILERSR